MVKSVPSKLDPGKRTRCPATFGSLGHHWELSVVALMVLLSAVKMFKLEL